MKNRKGITLIKLLIGIVLLAVGIYILSQSFSPEAPIKKMVSCVNSKNPQALMKCFDFAAMKVFYELGEDNLDDFWDEYEKFKDSDEYEDFVEEYEEAVEDMTGLEDDEDSDLNMKMTFEKVKSKEKVSKNLYKVKAKIGVEYEMDDNEMDTSATLTFFVVKNGFSYKIAGISLEDMLSPLMGL